MKVQIKLLFIVIPVILFSSIALGAIKYGEATIRKGNVVIVRKGRMYLYTKTNNPVTLFENDTIRTLKNSALVMTNPDQHRVILGANAIMQLKKWRKKRQRGTIRMLFGKFRARTAKLRKRSALNLRTATATIGIKGSLGGGATAGNFTSLSNMSGDMSVNGVTVPTGQFGINVAGLSQDIVLGQIPDFDPGKSEEEMESENSEEMDTKSSKKVNLPPAIRKAIVKKLTEVAQASGEAPPDDNTSNDELLEIFVDMVDALPDDVSGTPSTIDAAIEIED